jgi:comEA protein
MLINFFRKLGLTKSESVLILFLLIIFVSGLVLSNIFKKDLPGFDYSHSDLKFEKSVSKAFSELNRQLKDNKDNEKLEMFISAKDSLESFFDNQKDKTNNQIIVNKVNINLALEKDFEQLPGIGPVIAERIVSYREKINKFKSINEITEVKGIGQKKFDAIKNYLTIE